MNIDEAAKEARRAYKREWARKNPDKVKAQQERYWAKKAAQQKKTANESTSLEEKQRIISSGNEE